jgi:hypothetical protein
MMITIAGVMRGPSGDESDKSLKRAAAIEKKILTGASAKLRITSPR